MKNKFSGISSGIISARSSFPTDKVSNTELIERYNLTSVDPKITDEWIRSKCGVESRRFPLPGEYLSDFAIQAAKDAIEEAQISPSAIDAIIMATITGDYITPATAALIQHGVGATNAGAFDLSAGCSGFVKALITARSMVESGMFKNILVVGGDWLTEVTDFKERSCFLFGCGVGAAIVSQVDDDLGFIASVWGSDGSGVDKLYIPAGGSRLPVTAELIAENKHKMLMSGREVYKFAVQKQAAMMIDLLKLSEWDMPDYIIPHQANLRIIEAGASHTGIPIERWYRDGIIHFGNTSSGSVAMALHDAKAKHLIKKGDDVILFGFGAGLSWAGLSMKQAY